LTKKPPLWKIYLLLLKIKVVFLLQATAICGILTYDLKEGYNSGRNYTDSLWTCLVVVIGGSLASGGAMAINMWYERDLDALMKRTEERPIPAGHISPNHALIFGISVSIIGILLVTFEKYEAGIITAFSALFYICIYTMILKRRTPQNIVIGGLAGATPPLIGWAAASGEFESSFPWLLLIIIFFWTPPHFWALTLSKRKDYGNAGVPMLPVVKGEKVTRNHIMAYSISLILINLTIIIIEETGFIFAITSLLMSGYFNYLSWILLINKKEEDAWKLFKYSNFYLYALFAIVILDTAYHINFY
jgi:protoheme IX farnesyltransferase|tara:strand:+ start:7678 stop:8589 length:912 start_codon:yes stop_codon:yes gene_type:complete